MGHEHIGPWTRQAVDKAGRGHIESWTQHWLVDTAVWARQKCITSKECPYTLTNREQTRAKGNERVLLRVRAGRHFKSSTTKELTRAEPTCGGVTPHFNCWSSSSLNPQWDIVGTIIKALSA